MFSVNPCKHPIVYLKDVPAMDLEALLDFMYRGEVDVEQTQLSSLMKTAEGLQVKGLAIADNTHLSKKEQFPTPTPPQRVPPVPFASPPAKRKRFHDDYFPISALSMLYNNNSPYDLSQKSSSSSLASQSDNVVNDRPSSASPPEDKPSTTQDATSPQTSNDQTSSTTQNPTSSGRSSTPSSTYHNKENFSDDVRSTVATPSPRTPQQSSTGETNCKDSLSNREDNEAIAGPSGVQGSSSLSEDDMVNFNI